MIIPNSVPTIAEVFRTDLGFTGKPGSCPHCGAVATFVTLTSAEKHNCRIFVSRNRCVVITEVAQCNACGCLVFGAMERGRGSSAVWPNETWPDHAPPDLEQDIRKPYDEARAVLSLSPTASAVLARRCLQHVIRERLDITKPSLFQEIEEAAKRGELTKPTADALHHVREIGNWGAHPSVDQKSADPASTIIEVTREEAEYTIETVEMVFDDLYVATARVKAMQARVDQAKGKTSGTPATM